MTTTPAGWYPDPATEGRPDSAGQRLRYWDGSGWTEHTHVYDALPSEAPAYGPARRPSGKATTTPDGRPLAGWGIRVGAYLIDSALTSTLMWIATFPLAMSLADQMLKNLQAMSRQSPQGFPDLFAVYDHTWGLFLAIGLIGFAVRSLYHLGFWRFLSATPGKLILGLRIEPREAPGPLTWSMVFRRWFLMDLVTVLSSGLFSIADLLWPLWDSRRQALHDKWPDTNVVHTR